MGATIPQYKQSMSGTIGSGLRVVMGGKSQRYYTLEHLNKSRFYSMGQTQNMLIDQILIGRDFKCQVRYDTSEYPTVSGVHAAIERDGDSWKLVHLSKTNSTYVNGTPVRSFYYLQPGDEIKLSSNGPRMRFTVPAGESAKISNLGLTARFNAFSQQSLRPYRVALWSIGIVLLLAIGGLSWWNWDIQEELRRQANIFSAQIADINKEIAKHTNHLGELDDKALELQAKATALGDSIMNVNRKLKDFDEKMAKMQKDVKNAATRANQAWKQAKDLAVVTHIDNAALQKVADDTYYIMFGIFFEGDCISSCSGTGFLLNNGKFVTAQHVVNPFMGGVSDENEALLYAFMDAMPESFTCKMQAVNPKGQTITREYKLNNSPFNCGRYTKKTIGTIMYEGMPLPVNIIDEADYRDYAWISVGANGSGMKYDNSLSQNMPNGAPLDILGFPQGVGAENLSKVSPISSQSTVARQGLDTDKCILLSNSETDHGNSGGPVLTVKDGEYYVVGILSGSNRLGSKTIDWDKVSRLSPDVQQAIMEQVSSAKMKDRVVPIANCN